MRCSTRSLSDSSSPWPRVRRRPRVRRPLFVRVALGRAPEHDDGRRSGRHQEISAAPRRRDAPQRRAAGRVRLRHDASRSVGLAHDLPFDDTDCSRERSGGPIISAGSIAPRRHGLVPVVAEPVDRERLMARDLVDKPCILSISGATPVNMLGPSQQMRRRPPAWRRRRLLRTMRSPVAASDSPLSGA